MSKFLYANGIFATFDKGMPKVADRGAVWRSRPAR
jgi:hypothetical protein